MVCRAMGRRVNRIVLHCSYSPFGDVDLIRSWHLKRGFSDIGYHYVVLNGYPDDESRRLYRPQFWLDGVVQTGRPPAKIGAHVRGHNRDSIGICLIGVDQFTQCQFESLTMLLRKLCREHPKVQVLGHYELLRPGDRPKTCPNLDMEWLRGMV